MTLTQEIKRTLKATIKENFGSTEANDPCYNLDLLAQAVSSKIEKKYTLKGTN